MNVTSKSVVYKFVLAVAKDKFFQVAHFDDEHRRYKHHTSCVQNQS